MIFLPEGPSLLLGFKWRLIHMVRSLGHTLILEWKNSVWDFLLRTSATVPEFSEPNQHQQHHYAILATSHTRMIACPPVLCASSRPTSCDSMNCSQPGSSVHGILQASILEWVAMPSSRGSSQPRDRTQVSHFVGGFFTVWATREAQITAWVKIIGNNT